MHSLEWLILTAAERVREMGNQRLADDLVSIASASHEYEPTPGAEERLSEMLKLWHERYGHLLEPKALRPDEQESDD